MHNIMSPSVAVRQTQTKTRIHSDALTVGCVSSDAFTLMVSASSPGSDGLTCALTAPALAPRGRAVEANKV